MQLDILLSSLDTYKKILAKKDIDKHHWAATVQQQCQYSIIAKTPWKISNKIFPMGKKKRWQISPNISSYASKQFKNLSLNTI